ncbi:hypothetical protein IM660_10330 [Ruania alkalisoli]|uniref:Uncharacterized protein n=1 Tax=Ruania alkalisoli TaxID=2779775 RepID=A0A7M1SNX7_9MICO|nr:hypothetical protein [Ruania alkalisoli]QOR69131.1 hypothetical protein IM660_10330 [Ruania alkalisoli]
MSTATTISLIRTLSKKAGLNVPKALETDLQRIDNGANVSAAEVDREALARTWKAAVADGRDPATDPDVQAHVTRWALERLGIADLIHTEADRERGEVLRRHTPALLKVWSTAAAEAGERILPFSQAHPAIDLASKTPPTALATAHVPAWREAIDAVGTLRTIRKMWGLLFGPQQLNRELGPLAFADLDAEEVTELAYSHGGKPEVWRAATLAPVVLTDRDGFYRRVEGVQRQRERDAENESAERAWSRQHSLAPR